MSTSVDTLLLSLSGFIGIISLVLAWVSRTYQKRPSLRPVTPSEGGPMRVPEQKSQGDVRARRRSAQARISFTETFRKQLDSLDAVSLSEITYQLAQLPQVWNTQKTKRLARTLAGQSIVVYPIQLKEQAFRVVFYASTPARQPPELLLANLVPWEEEDSLTWSPTSVPDAEEPLTEREMAILRVASGKLG